MPVPCVSSRAYCDIMSLPIGGYFSTAVVATSYSSIRGFAVDAGFAPDAARVSSTSACTALAGVLYIQPPAARAQLFVIVTSARERFPLYVRASHQDSSNSPDVRYSRSIRSGLQRVQAARIAHSAPLAPK